MPFATVTTEVQKVRCSINFEFLSNDRSDGVASIVSSTPFRSIEKYDKNLLFMDHIGYSGVDGDKTDAFFA